MGEETGKVVVGFGGGLAGLFNEALVAQHDQGSSKGKIGS
jgi:hypothetical protein